MSKMPYVNSSQDTGRPTDTNNCLYCKHSVWSVGIGQGFYCQSTSKMDKQGSIQNSVGHRRFNIPSRTYLCEFYEWNGQELYTCVE